MWQRRCPPTLYDYKFKMAATKSEQEITITVGDCDRRDSKLGCVQIFDHGPLWLVMTRIGLRGHLMPWRTWIDVARWYIALPKLKMAAIKSEVEKTNERREMHAPRFQPIKYPRIISATPDLNIILSKLFDIARRWSTTVNQDGGHPKPQIRIERTGRTCMPDSNGYSIICDHAGHVCDTADIDRRCSYQNSRRRPPLSVSNLWLPWILVVDRRRTKSTESYLSRAWSKTRW